MARTDEERGGKKEAKIDESKEDSNVKERERIGKEIIVKKKK